MKAKIKSAGKPKKYCRYFNSTVGCYKVDCTWLHDHDPKYLKSQLDQNQKLLLRAAKELDAAREFSAVREAMKKSLKRFEVKFAERLRAANTVDIAIVMDCTGSMSSWITTAQSQLSGVVDAVKADHSGASVRVGFVAYRDFCDGDKRLAVQGLTADLEQAKRFIHAQVATGGGDEPEDIPGGLEAALGLDWQAEARCVILVADAPCHGGEFHDSSDSAVSQAQMHASPCIKAQLRTLALGGCDFAFIELRPFSTKKMADILEREYASVTPKDGFRRTFTRTQLGSHDDIAKFVTVVKHTASASLSASKSRSVVVGDPGPGVGIGMAAAMRRGPLPLLARGIMHAAGVSSLAPPSPACWRAPRRISSPPPRPPPPSPRWTGPPSKRCPPCAPAATPCTCGRQAEAEEAAASTGAART